MQHGNRVALALACATVAICAAVHLYRSPWSASSLDAEPDSVEYATVARRIATVGRASIVVGGQERPSRYAPWFPAMLAPAYAVAPGEPGASIIPVLILACCGVVAAFLIAKQAGGAIGGILAAALLVHLRTFHGMARLVMSDVPALSLTLMAIAVSVRGRDTRRSQLAVGALLAAAAAIRPLYAVFLLPAVLPAILARQVSWSKLLALFAPTALVGVVTALYNRLTFGSWTRTGYNYWNAVPYDYRNLVVNAQYLSRNLTLLATSSIWLTVVAGAVGLLVLILRRSPDTVRLRWFAVLGALPMSLMHMVYYYPEYRFHLPLLALCLIAAATAASATLPERLRRSPALVTAVALACAASCWPSSQPVPQRRLVAQSIARAIPQNAVLVSNTSAVYLQPLVLAETQRMYVPLSHQTQYANMLIVRRRVANPIPPPASAIDYRCEGLARGGAEEVFPFTALTDASRLQTIVWSRRPVYLDISSLPDAGPSLRTLEQNFRLVPLQGCPWVLQMLPVQPRQGR